MTRKLVVAAAQTGSVTDGDFRSVSGAALSMMDEAARQGVRLLTFAELFLTPFFANQLKEDFDAWFLRDDDPILLALRERARAHGMALILPFAERCDAGYFNSAFVFDETGREVGRYRKTHIPAYFPTDGLGGTGSYEKLYFTPGTKLETYAVCGIRIGVQICNDRLYPEASRVLALAVVSQ